MIIRFAGLLAFCAFLTIRGAKDACGDGPDMITNSIGMKLVLVPAGSFMMGADQDPSETLKDFPYAHRKWIADEAPRHLVKITKPFYMGQCEVTVAQFVAYCDGTNTTTQVLPDEDNPRLNSGKPPSAETQKAMVSEWRYSNPGWQIDDNHPVVWVSWNDAAMFCRWLSERESKTYRLPTEAEWEYACRAGTSSRYSFGDDAEELVQHGNVADRDCQARLAKHPNGADCDRKMKSTGLVARLPLLTKSDGFNYTAPVGKFPPNRFGLRDMHGNVSEWCADVYAINYYDISPTDDPHGPRAGMPRVIRGGGYQSTPLAQRSAYRLYGGPGDHHYSVGFRVVCEQ